jgi:dihydropyrimidinase
VANLKEWEQKNQGRAYVDWSLHGLVYDADAQTLADIPALVKLGVPTYKCFTTYRHSGRLMDDDSMLLALRATADSGGMLMVHCEHDAICEYLTRKAIDEGNLDWIYHARSRPALAEDMAIQRVVDLLKIAPAPVYIVHASTAGSSRIIGEAQALGLPLRAETCTHYLTLSEEKLKGPNGYLYICSPPLRTERDIQALWRAVRRGPLEVVSSDDAGLPSDLRERLAQGRFDKVPNGLPGVEPRLTLLYSEGVRKNRIDLLRLVELTAANPAKLFGLRPRKGSLAPGADADIVLFDPGVEWVMSAATLHMNTDFCPFEGQKVVGKVKTLLCRGEVVLRDYELVGSPDHGRRVFRKLENETANIRESEE